MNPRVSIIILNWNGWRDTIECLESLYQITYPDYDVIVVDNGSVDESIEKIKEYCEGKIEVNSRFFEYSDKNKPIIIIEYPREEAESCGSNEKEIADLPSNRKLILIKNEKNYGFAEGNNIAMRYALTSFNPDYILLLNNDTVVDKGFLTELVKIADNDEIGFTGPKTYYYNFNGRRDIINFAGGKLNMWKGKSHHIGGTEIDIGQHDNVRKVDYIEGSCMLVRKEIFTKIGLLDPKYFAYWEETDWCMRGHRAGYKLVYAPKSKIWHKVSSSVNSKTKIYYLTRNRFWFMEKYATKSQFFSFLLYFFGFQFWFISGIHIVYDQDINAFISFVRGVVNGIKTHLLQR